MFQEVLNFYPADLICRKSIMNTHHLIEDVNTTLAALENVKERKRPWRA